MAYENRYGIDNSRRSFSQWLDKALADDYFKEGFSDEDFFDVSWEIEWGIMRINNACTILKERFMEHISIVTNEERKMVGHVGALCTDIERYMDARNYKLAKNLIQEKLIPSIIEQNPNYKVFFEREYRWDEYEVVD